MYLTDLQFAGVTDKSSFWDSKTRGANGGQKGELLWDLDSISHCFTDSMYILFISLSGQIKAVTSAAF